MLSSIVNIESINENNSSFGTGFVIHNDEKGVYILTCQHVLDDVETPMVEEVLAKVIATSDFIDMAVIYVSKLHLQPLPMQVDACDSLNVDVIGFSHFNKHLTQKKHIHATLFKEAIELHSNEDDSFYLARKIKANNNFNFDRGNSGSPVICKKSGHVIAMISNKEGNDIGYAIEIANIEKIWQNIPPTLLEKGEFLHNHLPLNLGEKKEDKKENTKTEIEEEEVIPKKERKLLRYIVAGIITISLLIFGYLFFFTPSPSKPQPSPLPNPIHVTKHSLKCTKTNRILGNKRVDYLCSISPSVPSFKYALYQQHAISALLLDRDVKSLNPDSLSIISKNNNWYLAASKFAKVVNVASNDTLNIRKAPTSTANIIRSIKNGSKLEVNSCKEVRNNSKWCSINYANIHGWVNSRYIKYVSPRPLYDFKANRLNAEKALEQIKRYSFNGIKKMNGVNYLIKKPQLTLIH